MSLNTSRMRIPALLLLFSALQIAMVQAATVTATRFAENPLLTVNSSPSIGDNINGPAVIRVPDWVKRPLGRYYMYFAHHKGQYIRLAYADSILGPWRIYEPGVLKVSETAFYRPQPDPDPAPSGVYTHIASPDIHVDQSGKRIVMWFHGLWTEGQRWPAPLPEARAWLSRNGYAQYTQAAVSTDGIHFEPQPPITKDPYLRVFPYNGEFFGIARLGHLLHSKDLLSGFEIGGDPFGGGPYAGRVRHVALLKRENQVEVFLTAIGEAPESVLHTTIALDKDWKQWKATTYEQILTPQASYECPTLPEERSEVGEIYGPAKQLRDPAVFEEGGKVYLFYTVCGEQGIAGAEVTIR